MASEFGETTHGHKLATLSLEMHQQPFDHADTLPLSKQDLLEDVIYKDLARQ